MCFPLIKHFPNITWVLVILVFKENYGGTAGFKNNEDGKFMLVETPDNEKSQNSKYLLVEKDNEMKSLIEIDSNQGSLHTLNRKCILIQ